MTKPIAAFAVCFALGVSLLAGCTGTASGTPTSSPATAATMGSPGAPSSSATLHPTFTTTISRLVPSQYQPLYDHLQTYLTHADAEIRSGWDGRSYPVDYAAELLTADGNAGPGILQSSTQQVMTDELDGELAMGVKAITVQIGFPVFDQDFYVSAGESVGQAQQTVQNWLDYYKSVAQAIHARGLKMIGESNPLITAYISSTSSFNPGNYFKSLDFATYETLRSEHNLIIARQIKPDYLLLQTEPQTDAFNDYRPELNNPVEDTAMVARFVADLESAGIPGLHTSLQLGSGAGAWQPQWKSYMTGLAAVSGLDKLDTHVYSLWPDDSKLGEIGVASQIADMAHAAGKGVSMSEFWFHKADSQGGLTGNAINEIQARDLLSFWAPLDSQFFPMIARLADSKHFDYVSGFGHYNWFALVDYGSLSSPPAYPTADTAQNSATDSQIIRIQNLQARQALAQHQLSPDGKAYQAAIKGAQ